MFTTADTICRGTSSLHNMFSKRQKRGYRGEFTLPPAFCDHLSTTYLTKTL